MSDILHGLLDLDALGKFRYVSHGAKERWHEYPDDCHHDEPVYLRSVLANEVLFECDTGTYDEQRPQIAKFIEYLRSVGIEPLVAWSGSKSFHVSVFFDPASAFNKRLLDLDVDLFKVARKTIWEELPRRAGVTLHFDSANVRASEEKMGRMVRWAGSVKPDAKPGTTSFTFLNNGIPVTRPTATGYELPARLPSLWDVPDDLSDLIAAAADFEPTGGVEVDEETFRLFKNDWRAALGNAPWVRDGTVWESPRYPRAGVAFRAMLTVGMTREEARAELEKLKAHVPTPLEDGSTYDWTVWKTALDDVYNHNRVLDSVDAVEYATRKSRERFGGRKPTSEAQTMPGATVHSQKSPTMDSEVSMEAEVAKVGEVSEHVHSLTDSSSSDVQGSLPPNLQTVVSPSGGTWTDVAQTVDMPGGRAGKSPTLVSRIVQRRHGRGLRESLGIEVYDIKIDEDGEETKRLKQPSDIAEQLEGLFDFACPWKDDQPLGLRVYDNGVFVPAKKMLNRLLRLVLPGEASKTGYLNEIMAYLRDANSFNLEEFDNGEDGWLNTLTCWVNVNTRETREHSPKHLSMKQLPVKYEAGAACPTIDALFRQWVDDPLILYENLAHCLISNDYPIQTVLILIGTGQNGKSSYLRLVTNFLGKENVSAIELQAFGVNRFASQKLIGKFANICADMDRKRFTNTAEFKKLTGEDVVQAEIKNGALFEFFNYAKFMVSVNQLPPSPDDSDAFHRRIYRQRFDHKFTGKSRRRMRDLLRSAQAEFSGLLNRCLEVLPALLERNVFSGDTEDTDQKRESYTRGAEPVYGFWEDHLNYDSNSNGTVKDDLFTKFTVYAKTHDVPSMKLTKFFLELKSEMIKRGFSYETHRVGPEDNRGPRLLKGVVYVEQKAEESDDVKKTLEDPRIAAAKAREAAREKAEARRCSHGYFIIGGHRCPKCPVSVKPRRETKGKQVILGAGS